MAIEQYKKETGIQSLSYTNKIAEEQAVLQLIEAEKAALVIGNEENTESLLKQTSEDGIIRMSVQSLFYKIAQKNEQNGHELHFTWRSTTGPPRTDEQHMTDKDRERETVYDPEECYKQLDTLREYIEGFQKFLGQLNEPVKDKNGVQLSKKTFFQKALDNLENPTDDATRAVNDEIEDFKAFDPSLPINR